MGHMGIGMHPSWVMMGVELPDGRVRLIASNQLSYSELKVEYAHQDLHMWDFDIFPAASVLTRQDITLTTHLRTFTIVEADTWEQAFSGLFAQWKPERAARPAIQNQRALEG
jgi:hypothetical protein